METGDIFIECTQDANLKEPKQPACNSPGGEWSRQQLQEILLTSAWLTESCWEQPTNSMDMSLSKWDGEGQGSLACCSSWGCKELDMTEWLNKKQLQMLGEREAHGRRGKNSACSKGVCNCKHQFRGPSRSSKNICWTSLVVQRIRILLPRKGTQVQSLVQ